MPRSSSRDRAVATGTPRGAYGSDDGRRELVRVFGGSGQSTGGPRQAGPHGSPLWRGGKIRRYPRLTLRLLGRGERVQRRRTRQDDDFCGRASAGNVSAFDRAGGIEHERPGHVGQREVEADVKDDDDEQWPPALHGPILPESAPHRVDVNASEVAVGRCSRTVPRQEPMLPTVAQRRAPKSANTNPFT